MQPSSETYYLSNNFSGVSCIMNLKYFSLWQQGNEQCRRWTVTNIYYCWAVCWAHFTWPPYLATILGHHTWPYLATILGHHDRKTKITVTHHLDTVSNRRSHQIISYLISWMSTYSETQANFKNPSYIFPGGPLSTHPTQTPNFLLTTTLSTLPKPSVLRLLPRSVWLSARKTPRGRCETI